MCSDIFVLLTIVVRWKTTPRLPADAEGWPAGGAVLSELPAMSYIARTRHRIGHTLD